MLKNMLETWKALFYVSNDSQLAHSKTHKEAICLWLSRILDVLEIRTTPYLCFCRYLHPKS
jgi:hypothetical protein